MDLACFDCGPRIQMMEWLYATSVLSVLFNKSVGGMAAIARPCRTIGQRTCSRNHEHTTRQIQYRQHARPKISERGCVVDRRRSFGRWTIIVEIRRLFWPSVAGSCNRPGSCESVCCPSWRTELCVIRRRRLFHFDGNKSCHPATSSQDMSASDCTANSRGFSPGNAARLTTF